MQPKNTNSIFSILLSFALSSYFLVCALPALAALLSIFNDGLALISKWVFITAAIIYLLGAAFNFYQSRVRGTQLNKLCLYAAPAMIVVTVFNLGFNEFLGSPAGNTSVNQVERNLSELLPTVGSFLILALSVIPFMFAIGDSQSAKK